MWINKGDRVILADHIAYKVVKEFNFEEAFKSFSFSAGYVEEFSDTYSNVLLSQFTKWLIQNEFVKESTKVVIEVNVYSFPGPHPHVQASTYREGQYDQAKINLDVGDEVSGPVAKGVHWSIKRENHEDNY